MKRWSILVILAIVLANLAILPGTRVGAQDGGGAPVTIIGSDGAEQATMSVDGLLETFEDYDSGSEPDRGMHYVLATITVTNTGAQDFIVDSYAFRIIDSDGFVASPTWVYRSDRDYAPDFSSTPISPGDSATGSVFFAVYDASTANIVAYNGPYTRYVILSEQNPVQAAIGDPVDAFSSDGNPVGTVTVDDVTTDVTGVYPGYEPYRGYRYVQITVTIDNTSRRPIDMSPSYFSLIDSEGYLATATTISFSDEPETPELGYEPVPGNDTVTGRIAFQVYVAADAVRVIYQPSYEQFFTVALLDEAAIGPVAPAGAPSGASAGGSTGAALSPECSDADAWHARTDERLTAFFDTMATFPDEPTAADADDIRAAADDARDLLAEQEADVAPEIAADLETATLLFIDGLASYFDDVADALEQGNDIDDVLATYEEDLGAVMLDIERLTSDLATACDLDI